MENFEAREKFTSIGKIGSLLLALNTVDAARAEAFTADSIIDVEQTVQYEDESGYTSMEQLHEELAQVGILNSKIQESITATKFDLRLLTIMVERLPGKEIPQDTMDLIEVQLEKNRERIEDNLNMLSSVRVVLQEFEKHAEERAENTRDAQILAFIPHAISATKVAVDMYTEKLVESTNELKSAIERFEALQTSLTVVAPGEQL